MGLIRSLDEVSQSVLRSLHETCSGGGYGLAAMSIGVGQGVAVALEA
jgi:acetyl-CoA acetyltransferase